MKPIRRLLIANRSEIAIRVSRSAHELGIRTVAIYSYEDRYALHRFKADEAYVVGVAGRPLQAYMKFDDIVSLALEREIDAIHPGYGFLSENAGFADRAELRQCAARAVGDIADAVHVHEHIILAELFDCAFQLADHE